MVATQTSDYALRKAIIEANAMVSDNKGRLKVNLGTIYVQSAVYRPEVISRIGGIPTHPHLRKAGHTDDAQNYSAHRRVHACV